MYFDNVFIINTVQQVRFSKKRIVLELCYWISSNLIEINDITHKVLRADICRMLRIIYDKSFLCYLWYRWIKTFASVISHIQMIIREIKVHDINANLKKKTKSESYGTWLIDSRCSFILFKELTFYCRLYQNIKNTLWNETWGRIKVETLAIRRHI